MSENLIVSDVLEKNLIECSLSKISGTFSPLIPYDIKTLVPVKEIEILCDDLNKNSKEKIRQLSCLTKLFYMIIIIFFLSGFILV